MVGFTENRLLYNKSIKKKKLKINTLDITMFKLNKIKYYFFLF